MSIALDSEEECNLTLLPRSMCSHCKGLDERDVRAAAAGQIEVGVWIVARFPGVCPNCRRWYAEGDTIGRPGSEYGMTGWICRDCGS